jgi:hypothetical protein
MSEQKKKLSIEVKTLEVKAAPCLGAGTNACSGLGDPHCDTNVVSATKVAAIAFF